MRNPIRVAACLITTLAVALPVLAHSGRTDSNGGHWNRKTGEYHYHSGPKVSAPSASVTTPAPRPANRPSQAFSGQVVAVTDGDDLTVLTEREEIRVRLYGIDAPERNQPFGAQATQAAKILAHGKDVIVQVKDTDVYGRTVAEVVLPDGQSLNQALVNQGLAWWYEKYAPGDKVLEALERSARDAGRGLWSQPNPTAPWDFRRGRTETPSNESVQQFVEEQGSTAPVPREHAVITVYSRRVKKLSLTPKVLLAGAFLGPELEISIG